jgi:hypothetical protein
LTLVCPPKAPPDPVELSISLEQTGTGPARPVHMHFGLRVEWLANRGVVIHGVGRPWMVDVAAFFPVPRAVQAAWVPRGALSMTKS